MKVGSEQTIYELERRLAAGLRHTPGAWKPLKQDHGHPDAGTQSRLKTCAPIANFCVGHFPGVGTQLIYDPN
jgi:hypothetical protein